MAKKQQNKTKRINLRITPDQLKLLNKLAKGAKATVSGTVMALIGIALDHLKSE